MDGSYILIGLVAAIGVRVILHVVDKGRVHRELQARGAQVLSIKWNPFARGWFGEKGERHYDIVFKDRAGSTISTTCKTSLLTGIYWAEAPSNAEEKPRFESRLLCSGCGYALNAEWRFCPNCGKARVV
jgi:hypothetical protein